MNKTLDDYKASLQIEGKKKKKKKKNGKEEKLKIGGNNYAA